MNPLDPEPMPPVPTHWEPRLPDGWEKFDHWAGCNNNAWSNVNWMIRTGRLDSETAFRLLAAQYLAENVRLRQEVLNQALLKVEPLVIFKDELK